MKCLLHFWALLKTTAINLSMLSLSTWSQKGVNEGSALKQLVWKRKNVAIISNFRLTVLVICSCYQPGMKSQAHTDLSQGGVTPGTFAKMNWFFHVDYLVHSCLISRYEAYLTSLQFKTKGNISGKLYCPYFQKIFSLLSLVLIYFQMCNIVSSCSVSLNGNEG